MAVGKGWFLSTMWHLPEASGNVTIQVIQRSIINYYYD